MNRLRVVARAKLTLSLRVLGRRGDGFHDLEALVASVGQPADVVLLDPAGAHAAVLSVSGPAAAAVPADETNLAARAAAAHPSGPATVALHKCIPAGAGLGGGSADAAAVLVGLERAGPRSLGPAGLAEVAAALGSDVPFCVTGGLAWMRGRGERIDPLPPLAGPELVIAVPPFGVATAAVYRAWDELGGPRSPRSVPARCATLAGLVPDGLINDLEPAAEAVEPRLRPFREAVEETCSLSAVMAGSGSAYFVPVPAGTDAGALAAAVARRTGATTWATRPVRQGVELAGGSG